jgi:homocitrate synthase NifV
MLKPFFQFHSWKWNQEVAEVWSQNNMVIFKDSTMREGQDVPGVVLDVGQKRALLRLLANVGVPEVELVAPGRFDRDISDLKEMGTADLPVKLSGLIYGNRPGWREQIAQTKGLLNRFDILMPLSDLRPPVGIREKSKLVSESLKFAIDSGAEVGVGFPHATQIDQESVLEICLEAVQAGAKRITLYDTNGSGDPWTVVELIEKVCAVSEIKICFHAHNDLGMATANSLAAVRAGATFLDVTVNGLGDRAGNASLEQVAVALHLKEVAHGLRLDLLRDLSRSVEKMTNVPVSKLSPIVGDFAFCQKSPSHFEFPTLFEAFEPALVGAERSVS